jgi:hypothetical protein
LSLLRGRGDPLERLVERRGVLEPDLALRERPGREVDVRVVEAGEDTAAPEIHPIGAREGGLVRSDTTCDPLACDRQRTGNGECRLHRPDDPVLENHPRNLSGGSTVFITMHTLVILLLLVVMLGLATYWPTSD